MIRNKSHRRRLQDQEQAEQRELEQILENGDLGERSDGGGRGWQQFQGGRRGRTIGRGPADVHRRAHIQDEAA